MMSTFGLLILSLFCIGILLVLLVGGVQVSLQGLIRVLDIQRFAGLVAEVGFELGNHRLHFRDLCPLLRALLLLAFLLLENLLGELLVSDTNVLGLALALCQRALDNLVHDIFRKRNSVVAT